MYLGDLLGLDLSKLLGGNHFLISSILSINRYEIDLRPLIDTRAASFLFINRSIAKNIRGQRRVLNLTIYY